jgi:hypothetical protein
MFTECSLNVQELEVKCIGVLAAMLLDVRVREALPDAIKGPFMVVNQATLCLPRSSESARILSTHLWNPDLDNVQKV